MNTPIVWTIAGADSSGCSGIAADLKTFQRFNVHGCAVVTAVTAQHFHELSHIDYLTPLTIQEQIHILQKEASPKAIKIGMLGSFDLSSFLENYKNPVILDPLLQASSGKPLFASDETSHINNLRKLFPFIYLLTPNIPEAQALTNHAITSYQDIEIAAKKLINLGVKNVLIKGGHWDSAFSQDYWTNGREHCWFANPRDTKDVRGTGCTLSSAITALLAQDHDLLEALTLAKTYVNQAIRESTKPWLHHTYAALQQKDLPYAALKPFSIEPFVCKDCGPTPLGLYPIVPNSEWLARLLPLGITTIQLRIKNKDLMFIEKEIQKSITLANQYHARLFINDYWELAIRHKAYGVHLGQEDLTTASISAIQHAGLRLGISTHNYYELARAHAVRPSYIAFGAIFATQTK
ncbi:hypothetical protein AYO45_03235, partial [Gammaproteobacteria bacterium SCGC AG-212-F23]